MTKKISYSYSYKKSFKTILKTLKYQIDPPTIDRKSHNDGFIAQVVERQSHELMVMSSSLIKSLKKSIFK